jgi:hypothetical protein
MVEAEIKGRVYEVPWILYEWGGSSHKAKILMIQPVTGKMTLASYADQTRTTGSYPVTV